MILQMPESKTGPVCGLETPYKTWVFHNDEDSCRGLMGYDI